MTSYLLLNYGLNYAFIIPGATAVIISLPIYAHLYNSPAEIGLTNNSLNDLDNKIPQNGQGKSVTVVFRYPFFWAITVGYFAVAFVKFAIADWGQLYMMQEKETTLYEGMEMTIDLQPNLKRLPT